MFDLLIANGSVIDGSGAPRRRVDVGIVGDRIAEMGDLDERPARDRIDAEGLAVAPGLIDVHVHSESALLRERIHEAGLRQGITTHVLGQDGFGFAPTNAETLDFMTKYLAAIYGDDPGYRPGGIGAFLSLFDGATTVNVATLIPAGCIRMNVLGNSSIEPTPRQLEAMREACRQGMREGALGISSGLDYTPGCYASTEELAALCEAVTPYHGIYVTHVRYRLGLGAAVEEALAIGRLAGTPVHISHLFADEAEHVTAEQLLELLAAAEARGVPVSYDTYPYLYGSTLLAYVLPVWVLEGSFTDVLERLRSRAARDRIRAEVAAEVPGWSQFLIAGELHGRDAALTGVDVLDAAGGSDPVDFLCDLLVAHDLDVLLVGKEPTGGTGHDGLETMLGSSKHVLGSDGIYRGRGIQHPRGFGAFARYLTLTDGSLGLEGAVSHATSSPAARFGLRERGLLREGFFADLFTFDPRTLADRARLPSPREPATGVRDVVVNGVPVLRDGAATGSTPGRALRRQPYALAASRIPVTNS